MLLISRFSLKSVNSIRDRDFGVGLGSRSEFCVKRVDFFRNEDAKVNHPFLILINGEFGAVGDSMCSPCFHDIVTVDLVQDTVRTWRLRIEQDALLIDTFTLGILPIENKM